ncbi:hypothetical protein EMIT048CA2_140059 [Pseudomonas chlororaphis]
MKYVSIKDAKKTTALPGGSKHVGDSKNGKAYPYKQRHLPQVKTACISIGISAFQDRG